MNSSNDRTHFPRTLRAFMTVAAALCVIGLAGLLFVRMPDPTIGALDAYVTRTEAAPRMVQNAGSTGVPSAESVFRDKLYLAPEAPIAQF